MMTKWSDDGSLLALGAVAVVSAVAAVTKGRGSFSRSGWKYPSSKKAIAGTVRRYAGPKNTSLSLRSTGSDIVARVSVQKPLTRQNKWGNITEWHSVATKTFTGKKAADAAKAWAFGVVEGIDITPMEPTDW